MSNRRMSTIQLNNIKQAWGQIHEYLYLDLFKYFFEYLYFYLYFEILKQEVFVFVFEILHEIFKCSFLNCFCGKTIQHSRKSFSPRLMSPN